MQQMIKMYQCCCTGRLHTARAAFENLIFGRRDLAVELFKIEGERF